MCSYSWNKFQVLLISQNVSWLLYARLKNGTYYGNTCGMQHPQGFCSLSQRVFIRSWSNLVNMLVGIISWPSSKTSQIPSGTPELWPLNCPKLSKIMVLLSKSWVFIWSWSNLVNMLVGIISRPSSITCQSPPGFPELWSLNCQRNWISGIYSPSWISNVFIIIEFVFCILCQFGTLAQEMVEQYK